MDITVTQVFQPCLESNSPWPNHHVNFRSTPWGQPKTIGFSSFLLEKTKLWHDQIVSSGLWLKQLIFKKSCLSKKWYFFPLEGVNIQKHGWNYHLYSHSSATIRQEIRGFTFKDTWNRFLGTCFTWYTPQNLTNMSKIAIFQRKCLLNTIILGILTFWGFSL